MEARLQSCSPYSVELHDYRFFIKRRIKMLRTEGVELVMRVEVENRALFVAAVGCLEDRFFFPLLSLFKR